MQVHLQDCDAVAKSGRFEGIPLGPAAIVSVQRRAILSHRYKRIISIFSVCVRGAGRAVLPCHGKAGGIRNAGFRPLNARLPAGGGAAARSRRCSARPGTLYEHGPKGRPAPFDCARREVAPLDRHARTDFRSGLHILAGLPALLTLGDAQNEPLADTAYGTTGDAIVLERNIVRDARRSAIDGSQTGSRGMAGCNWAQEQSLVPRERTRLACGEGASKLVRRITGKSGTNGEENLAVKLYARFEAVPGQKWDSRAAFTECYAVLEKIMGSTPGKGDGS